MRVFLGLVLAVTLHAEAWRFSIVGDRTGSVQPGVFERVWAEVVKEKPDFVINVGDSVQNGTRAEWEEYLAIVKPAGLPLYFTAGNHDFSEEASRKRFEEATGRPATYSFDHKGAHFTVLDNSQADELSESELNFLRKDLEKNRKSTAKFVFFHRPFWWLLAKMQNRDFELHKIAKEHGVCCIISGHAHVLIHALNDGITYLAVGSSGGHLRGEYNFEKGSIFHYTLVTVDGSKVTFTIKEVPPAGKEAHSFDVSTWPE